MPKAKETVLEIDLKALAHNYAYLRDQIDKSTMFMGVVKAFAYGSDSIVIAQKLQDLGADYLAVAYAKEGIALRKAGITLPILVLHPLPTSFKKIIKHRLEPNIYSFKILKEFMVMAQKRGEKKYPVHLKFNTGLNRLGFVEEDVDEICQFVESQSAVQIDSVFSHLAASEDLNEREFTLNQLTRFDAIAEKMRGKLTHVPFRHTLNTSGIINYAKSAQYEMVRSGIGLYGYGNEAFIDKKLKPVATLKTIISQIHEIKAGESIGYNRKYKADASLVTATLPVGHADGIGRIYGNKNGFVYINGQRAFIIGNVCMDMIMVDITDIDCKEGDEVILFGAEHSAEKLALGASTISYELLTGISQRVKRRVKEE